MYGKLDCLKSLFGIISSNNRRNSSSESNPSPCARYKASIVSSTETILVRNIPTAKFPRNTELLISVQMAPLVLIGAQTHFICDGNVSCDVVTPRLQRDIYTLPSSFPNSLMYKCRYRVNAKITGSK